MKSGHLRTRPVFLIVASGHSSRSESGIVYSRTGRKSIQGNFMAHDFLATMESVYARESERLTRAVAVKEWLRRTGSVFSRALQKHTRRQAHSAHIVRSAAGV